MSKDFNHIAAEYARLRRELHKANDSATKAILNAKLREPFNRLRDYLLAHADDEDWNTLKDILEAGLDEHYKDD